MTIRMPLPFNGAFREGSLGLANEKELIELCPEEFKKPNKWSEGARRISKGEADIKDFQGKGGNLIIRLIRLKERDRFFEILNNSPNLNEEMRMAIAGWMLSEMSE